jgi:hypothetical protein
MLGMWTLSVEVLRVEYMRVNGVRLWEWCSRAQQSDPSIDGSAHKRVDSKLINICKAAFFCVERVP